MRNVQPEMLKRANENFNEFFVSRMNKECDVFLEESGYYWDSETDEYCYYIDNIEWMCSDNEPAIIGTDSKEFKTLRLDSRE